MIREQGPGLEQEGPVVADVVDDRQPLVVVGLAPPASNALDRVAAVGEVLQAPSDQPLEIFDTHTGSFKNRMQGAPLDLFVVGDDHGDVSFEIVKKNVTTA